MRIHDQRRYNVRDCQRQPVTLTTNETKVLRAILMVYAAKFVAVKEQDNAEWDGMGNILVKIRLTVSRGE